MLNIYVTYKHWSRETTIKSVNIPRIVEKMQPQHLYTTESPDNLYIIQIEIHSEAAL